MCLVLMIMDDAFRCELEQIDQLVKEKSWKVRAWRVIDTRKQ